MNHTMPERQLSPASLPDLTVGEINAVAEFLDSRAEDEFLNCTTDFQEWLHGNAKVLLDWQQYRAATISDEEKIRIEQELGMRT